jgi:hypothetical protein
MPRKSINRRQQSKDQPNLGLATTRELLDELRARFEIHAAGGLDYRTVDDERIAKRGRIIAPPPLPTTIMKPGF